MTRLRFRVLTTSGTATQTYETELAARGVASR